MIQQQIADAASLQRQGLLAAAMDERAAYYQARSEWAAARGYYVDAARLNSLAILAANVAVKARTRLVTASQMAEVDVAPPGLADLCAGDDQPPSTLVSLSGWLRARLAALLPWVRAETWQQVAWLMLRDRGVQP